MSFVKMTDIVASTQAFIVTLSYLAKGKSNIDTSQEVIIEVSPIIQSATEDTGLAEQFFHIISSDSTSHNRRQKNHIFDAFIKGCTRKIFEQFWDSSCWDTLEHLAIRIPTITCLLYDKAGNLIHSRTASALDVMKAFKKLEEAFFFSLRQAPVHLEHHDKKAFKRDQNRSTHKYMMHHRVK